MNKLVKPFILIFAVALSSSAFSQQVDKGHELKQQGVRKVSEPRLKEPIEPRRAEAVNANSDTKDKRLPKKGDATLRQKSMTRYLVK